MIIRLDASAHNVMSAYDTLYIYCPEFGMYVALWATYCDNDGFFLVIYA